MERRKIQEMANIPRAITFFFGRFLRSGKEKKRKETAARRWESELKGSLKPGIGKAL